VQKLSQKLSPRGFSEDKTSIKAAEHHLAQSQYSQPRSPIHFGSATRSFNSIKQSEQSMQQSIQQSARSDLNQHQTETTIRTIELDSLGIFTQTPSKSIHSQSLHGSP
jgi:hypothetical protein